MQVPVTRSRKQCMHLEHFASECLMRFISLTPCKAAGSSVSRWDRLWPEELGPLLREARAIP
jgi:hypothetical protein